jgi:hypothetical protein
MLLCRLVYSIAASPDRVWQIIGRFDGLHTWHPVIGSCVSTQAGGDTIRTLTTVDGGVVIEKLLGHSDADRRYSYTIEESPLPVSGYRATLSVAPAGDRHALVSWESRFEATIPDEAAALDVIAGIFAAGLEALRASVEV